MHAACQPRKRSFAKRRKRGDGGERERLILITNNILPEYLHKDVYESQRCYDNGKDGCAGNNNYHGGERNKEGGQEHEHGGRKGLVYDVDVLGEAVDDTS